MGKTAPEMDYLMEKSLKTNVWVSWFLDGTIPQKGHLFSKLTPRPSQPESVQAYLTMFVKPITLTCEEISTNTSKTSAF